MTSRISPKNAQQLKILKNQVKGVDPKAIFDRIKAVGKQCQNTEQLQYNISRQLSSLLKNTVSVSVVRIKQLTECQSHMRQVHRYKEPNVILEDSLHYYRIWVQAPPQFKPLQIKRQIKQLKQLTISPQNYQA